MNTIRIPIDPSDVDKYTDICKTGEVTTVTFAGRVTKVTYLPGCGYTSSEAWVELVRTAPVVMKESPQPPKTGHTVKVTKTLTGWSVENKSGGTTIISPQEGSITLTWEEDRL